MCALVAVQFSHVRVCDLCSLLCCAELPWPRDVCARGANGEQQPENNCQGWCSARLDLSAEQRRELRERRKREQRLVALADPTFEPLASRAELDEFVRGGGSVEDLRASLWRTRGFHDTHECSCARGYELNAYVNYLI